MHSCGQDIPDSKVNGANMGPIWGRQDPCGPHVGHMNLAIWDGVSTVSIWSGIWRVMMGRYFITRGVFKTTLLPGAIAISSIFDLQKH